MKDIRVIDISASEIRFLSLVFCVPLELSRSIFAFDHGKLSLLAGPVFLHSIVFIHGLDFGLFRFSPSDLFQSKS